MNGGEIKIIKDLKIILNRIKSSVILKKKKKK